MSNTRNISSDKENNPTRKPSRGERLFNWLVYGGIAGVGVFIASIFAGYSAKYGKGKEFFSKTADKLGNLGIKKETAETAILMNTALSMPGNLSIIPIKWAEDHKSEIVEKLDNILGDKTDKKGIAEEPKQTWGSMIKGRLLAWGSVFFIFESASHLFGTDKQGNSRFQKFEENFSRNVICKPFNKPTHINGQETKLFKYGKVASLDFFATAAASLLLYFGSKFFAGIKDKRNGKSESKKIPEAETVVEKATGATQSYSDLFRKTVSHADTVSLRRDALDAQSAQIGA